MSTSMQDSRHILVVDDDDQICTMVSRYLVQEGFRVSTAANGEAVRQHFAAGDVNLVLLDIVMPSADGLQLAREIRSQSEEVGIIMLTGRTDTIDRVVGLEVGADDYIQKPFNLRELVARVRSVLRRLSPRAPTPITADPSALCFDGWTFDLGRRTLTSPQGRDVPLTTGEFDLLATLVSHAGRVLSRDRLMDLTKGRSCEAFDRTIDVQIVRLRRKIETDPRNPDLIKSVRGVGYVFTGRPVRRVNA